MKIDMSREELIVFILGSGYNLTEDFLDFLNYTTLQCIVTDINDHQSYGGPEGYFQGEES
jgi:hypothetical protein